MAGKTSTGCSGQSKSQGIKAIAMGVTKKAKIMFTCEHNLKEQLTELAKSQNRTVSNLVETLVIEALSANEKKTKAKE